eukprot:TRINITY_DN74906_c0_g1_i1.p1 TRINITY_DN74906_c0_g1~~TRINITY_DN74906_c0_g1_i1.p1  ORF type:complete len:244 (+),score=27.14 TRINITY_DN74906_c0_g1_i1:148-879(+)
MVQKLLLAVLGIVRALAVIRPTDESALGQRSSAFVHIAHRGQAAADGRAGNKARGQHHGVVAAWLCGWQPCWPEGEGSKHSLTAKQILSSAPESAAVGQEPSAAVLVQSDTDGLPEVVHYLHPLLMFTPCRELVHRVHEVLVLVCAVIACRFCFGSGSPVHLLCTRGKRVPRELDSLLWKAGSSAMQRDGRAANAVGSGRCASGTGHQREPYAAVGGPARLGTAERPKMLSRGEPSLDAAGPG